MLNQRTRVHNQISFAALGWMQDLCKISARCFWYIKRPIERQILSHFSRSFIISVSPHVIARDRACRRHLPGHFRRWRHGYVRPHPMPRMVRFRNEISSVPGIEKTHKAVAQVTCLLAGSALRVENDVESERGINRAGKKSKRKSGENAAGILSRLQSPILDGTRQHLRVENSFHIDHHTVPLAPQRFQEFL